MEQEKVRSSDRFSVQGGRSFLQERRLLPEISGVICLFLLLRWAGGLYGGADEKWIDFAL